MMQSDRKNRLTKSLITCNYWIVNSGLVVVCFSVFDCIRRRETAYLPYFVSMFFFLLFALLITNHYKKHFDQ
jgi:hypothetical protein